MAVPPRLNGEPAPRQDNTVNEPVPLQAQNQAYAPQRNHGLISEKKETSKYYAQPAELTGLTQEDYFTPQNIYNHEAFRARLWRGYKGASLYEVAKVWADEADVDLIWNAPRGMALKETISIRTPFANVIEQLLAQYNSKPYNLNGIMSINEKNRRPQLIVISKY